MSEVLNTPQSPGSEAWTLGEEPHLDAKDQPLALQVLFVLWI